MKHNGDVLFEISELIYKDLSGNATKEDQLKLDTWKNESEQNRMLYEQICSDEVMRGKKMCIRDSSKSGYLRFAARNVCSYRDGKDRGAVK